MTKSRAGWRVNGKRVYYAKGKTKTRKKTYFTKTGALKSRR